MHDLLSHFPRFPKKVTVGDITVRDGFQHEDRFIPTEMKLHFLEELIYAGARHLEVTNFGNPKHMPQFKDADELFIRLRSPEFTERLKGKGISSAELVLTGITIRERSVDRAIELKKRGLGPDRILMMVSTDEHHHYANSGTTLKEYWKEAERCIQKARDVGIEVCGTVSTIWGSPIQGETSLETAFEFTKRWLDIGASSIEHADHDGSGNAKGIYAYFSEILERFPQPHIHIAHYHETRRIGSANLMAALMAGISHFEATLGGIGGMPAPVVDGVSCGIGEYYFEDRDARYVGLLCLEDSLVQLEGLGIDHGYNTDSILKLGRELESILGRRLRSEAAINGRIRKEGHPEFIRPELFELKKKLGES